MYVAATVDGARVRLYIDGRLVADQTQTVIPQDSAHPLQIAGLEGARVDNALLGVVDGVSLYDRALSVDEIATLAGL